MSLGPLTEDQYTYKTPEYENNSDDDCVSVVLDIEEGEEEEEEEELCDFDADLRAGEYDAFEILDAFPGHDTLMGDNQKIPPADDDPHGYCPLTVAVPKGYCKHCHCKTANCHNKLFGFLYSSLQVCVFIERHTMEDLEQSHIVEELHLRP